MFDFETERGREGAGSTFFFFFLHTRWELKLIHIHGNFQPHKRTIYAEMQITIISGNFASVVNQSYRRHKLNIYFEKIFFSFDCNHLGSFIYV